MILNKRAYSTPEELTADYWDCYYNRERICCTPDLRLWQRMQADGPGSLAERLWLNQLRLLNTQVGMIWHPEHKTVLRKLFGIKKAKRRRTAIDQNQ